MLFAHRRRLSQKLGLKGLRTFACSSSSLSCCLSCSQACTTKHLFQSLAGDQSTTAGASPPQADAEDATVEDEWEEHLAPLDEAFQPSPTDDGHEGEADEVSDDEEWDVAVGSTSAARHRRQKQLKRASRVRPYLHL